MKQLFLPALVSAVVITSSAHACYAKERVSMAPDNGCELKETISMTVSFNHKAKSFSEARTVFDEQMKKIDDMAKQQKLQKFFLQNQNYSISSQPVSYGPDGTPDAFTYQVNGSMSYQLDNADTAFKFGEFLTAQKMQVNINSNAYRNGNCNQ